MEKKIKVLQKKGGGEKRTFGDGRIAVIVPPETPGEADSQDEPELKPSLPDFLLLFLTHKETREALLHSNAAALCPLSKLVEETNKRGRRNGTKAECEVHVEFLTAEIKRFRLVSIRQTFAALALKWTREPHL